MTRADAMPYVSFICDDAGRGDEATPAALAGPCGIKPDARLIGWQCGFEPLFVACQSYLPGIVLDDDEAADMARDFLAERRWFPAEATDPDYIL
jgi:hypothetical protein